ncbi:hypothetical protein OPQ81_000500 [Rhizoctonia solani]|nr:hypothetical protein OPQ81_000500 [Rhizoctonia solani]
MSETPLKGEKLPEKVGGNESGPRLKIEIKPEPTKFKIDPKYKSEPEAPRNEPEPEPEPEPQAVILPLPCRSGRVTRIPERYGAIANVAFEEALTAAMEEAPKTFKDAMSRPDAPQWFSGMNKELDLFSKHNVAKRVKRPKDKNVIKSLWVYTYKRGPDGEIKEHKCRLVAKGYSQKPGVDFGEISSPVAASDSFRILMGIATSEDLILIQLDIKTAFLHGILDEEIYMEPPEGFEDDKNYVWRLNKAFYGLKQAARAFYQQLRKVLEKIGFTHCETDHAVFILRDDEKLAIILAHVDNMQLAGKPFEFLESIKAEMEKSFELVDLGEPKKFVGIEIERDIAAGTLKIHQRQYINEILTRFDMSDCKPCDTPMAEGLNLPKLDSPTVDCTMYQCAIGSLMYAMTSTHPDIAYAVGLPSSACH